MADDTTTTAAKKYLDQTGVAYLWGKSKTYAENATDAIPEETIVSICEGTASNTAS